MEFFQRRAEFFLQTLKTQILAGFLPLSIDKRVPE
jgi:hypothetical protein